MIACSCNSVCDRTVMSSIADGATCIDELAADCGAGARCGGCHDTLGTLLAAARAVDAAFAGEATAGAPRVREAALG